MVGDLTGGGPAATSQGGAGGFKGLLGCWGRPNEVGTGVSVDALAKCSEPGREAAVASLISVSSWPSVFGTGEGEVMVGSSTRWVSDEGSGGGGIAVVLSWDVGLRSAT